MSKVSEMSQRLTELEKGSPSTVDALATALDDLDRRLASALARK